MNNIELPQVEFMTKSGKDAIIRMLQQEDFEDLAKFINELSAEDTFILYSGVQMSLEDEKAYVEKSIQNMEAGDALHLVCVVDGQIVSKSELARMERNKERSKHVASLGLSVSKDYRGDGIGKKMLETQLEQMPLVVSGIKLAELSVFSSNLAGIKLYESFGFKEVGRIPGGILHKDEYVDEIFMILAV